MAKLRPLIFIGCGGSGGKTIRLAHDAIMRRLRGKGWSGAMPDSFQFLWIDVPSGQEGGDIFGHKLRDSEYLGLVQSGTTYSVGIDAAVTPVRNMDPMEFAGWRPNPPDVVFPIEDGAGQFRAIGRMITLRNIKLIRDRITAAYKATTQGVAISQLEEVSKVLGATGTDPKAQVFIVSSLAGGSGAGTFLDVADVVAAVSNSSQTTAGVLYCADVFSSIPGTKGTEGNSLAALCELLNGFWADEVRPLTAMRAQGVSGKETTRGGIASTFLVGRANANGVSLNSSEEVFRAIGEMLGLLAVSPDVQEEMLDFIQANFMTSATNNQDLLGIQEPGAMAPVSSVGYARLGLGRDRLAEYSSRRLARAAIEFLTSGYLQEVPATQQNQTPQEIIKSLVDSHKMNFLDECGIHELDDPNAPHNQIVDAISPPERFDLWKELDNAVAAKQTAATDAEIGRWVERFKEASNLLKQEYNAKFDAALTASTKAWAKNAPGALLKTTNRYVASFGLPVTLEILAESRTQLQGAAAELLRQAGTVEVQGGNFLGRIGQLRVQATEKIRANHPKMAQVIQEVNSPLRYGSQGSIFRQASRLIGDFCAEVLEPLLESLKEAWAELQIDTGTRADGKAPEYLDWPSGGVIPAWLYPSQVEFLLDNLTTYPEVYDKLLVASLGKATEDLSANSPDARARIQVIEGGFTTPGEATPTFAIERDWPLSTAPTPWAPPVTGGLGGRLKFVARFRQSDLVQRAERWLSQTGAFRDHLHESLAEHFDDKPGSLVQKAPLEQRVSAFEAKLSTALEASAPLVDVDVNVYGITHPEAFGVSSSIEPLPFPMGHPARQAAERVLTKAGFIHEGEGPEKLFTSETVAGISSIGVVSFISTPLHPVVLSSVTRPIDDEVQSGNRVFWLWKRTRRLSEFVPVSSGARRAMIRGWYTAQLLGYAKVATRNDPGQVLEVDGTWLTFPDPPLGGVVGSTGLPISAVLESLPVAWLGWAAGRQEQILAYRRLFQLGLGDSGQDTAASGLSSNPEKLVLYSYDALNPELSEWIASGNRVVGAAAAMVSGDDASARAASVQAGCAQFMSELNGLRTKTKLTMANLVRAPRGIDIVNEVLAEVAKINVARWDAGGPHLH